jgi:hypothetical protein
LIRGGIFEFDVDCWLETSRQKTLLWHLARATVATVTEARNIRGMGVNPTRLDADWPQSNVLRLLAVEDQERLIVVLLMSQSKEDNKTSRKSRPVPQSHHSWYVRLSSIIKSGFIIKLIEAPLPKSAGAYR